MTNEYDVAYNLLIGDFSFVPNTTLYDWLTDLNNMDADSSLPKSYLTSYCHRHSKFDVSLMKSDR